MADRYWVGGSGLWSSIAHWSDTSGGSGGFSVPTSSDSVYLNSNSFSSAGQYIEIGAEASCLNLSCSDISVAAIVRGDYPLNVYGNFVSQSILSFPVSKIRMKGSSVTFAGRGLSYKSVELEGDTSITDSNIFTSLKIKSGLTVGFEAGKINEFGELIADGTALSYITLKCSTSGSISEFKKLSGNVRVRYCVLEGIVTAGGADFYAGNCVNNGNTTGWKYRDILGSLAEATNSLSGLMSSTDKGDFDDLYVRAKLDRVYGLTATISESNKMIVTFSAFRAYLLNGKRISVTETSHTIDNPSLVSHTDEVHTSVSGVVSLTYFPIVNDDGVLSISDVVVKKSSDDSSVSILSYDLVNGNITLDIESDISVKVTYNNGLLRYDTVYVALDGTSTLLKGTPASSNPSRPSVPNNCLGIADIYVEPKSTLGLETADVRIKKSSDEGNGIVVSTVEPSTKYENMFWLNPTNNVLKRWDGEAWHIISGGITVPYYHNVTLESAASEIEIGISTFDYNKDTLLVFQNSTYISKPDDYTVSADSKSIVKASGTWNLGTEFNFVVLASVSEDADILNISELESSYTASTDGETVIPINNSAYNKNTDILAVYFNNMRLHKTADYTVNEDAAHITLVGGNVIDTGEMIKFYVLKRIRTAAGTFDGSLAEDGSITEVKLNEDLVDKINTQYITDTATNVKYKLIVTNGVLGIEEV